MTHKCITLNLSELNAQPLRVGSSVPSSACASAVHTYAQNSNGIPVSFVCVSALLVSPLPQTHLSTGSPSGSSQQLWPASGE